MFSTDDLTTIAKRIIDFLNGYRVVVAVCEVGYLPTNAENAVEKLNERSSNYSILASNNGPIKPDHIIALTDRIAGAIEDYNSGNNPTFDTDKYPVLMLVIGDGNQPISAILVSIICRRGRISNGTEIMIAHDLCVAIQDYVDGQYALNAVYGCLFREKIGG